jgi:hypothetical protein
LPEKPEYEFLRARCYKEFNWNWWFRLKTIKLRWQVSQWLIMPLWMDREEWTDLTEELWVVKYDTELLREKSQGIYKCKYKGWRWYRFQIKTRVKVQLWIIKFDKEFPSFLNKTDEERIQNLQWMLNTNNLAVQVGIHEKIDWSSTTCYIKNWKFWVCSRNIDLQNQDNIYWRAVKELWVEEMMRKIRPVGEMAIQWELVWPWIQGNKYCLNSFKIYRFNVYDIQRKCYYRPKDFLMTDVVPSLWEIILHNNIPERVELSKGKSLLNPKTEREWIVVRSMDKSISFKVINPNFLLLNDE